MDANDNNSLYHRWSNKYENSHMLFNEFQKFIKKNLDTGSEGHSDSDSLDFKKAWQPYAKSYPLLCEFFGGLAAVFPSTPSVESDFSTMGYQKNTFRQSLYDVHLEGILHSKQYEDTKKILKIVKPDSDSIPVETNGKQAICTNLADNLLNNALADTLFD